jgi:hypothetical protein
LKLNNIYFYYKLKPIKITTVGNNNNNNNSSNTIYNQQLTISNVQQTTPSPPPPPAPLTISHNLRSSKMNQNNNSITTTPSIIRNQQTTTNYSNQQQIMRLPMNNNPQIIPTSSIVSSTTAVSSTNLLSPQQQNLNLHDTNQIMYLTNQNEGNNLVNALLAQIKPSNSINETIVTPTKSKPGRKPSSDKKKQLKLNNTNSTTLIMSPSPTLPMTKPTNDYSFNNNRQIINTASNFSLLNQNPLPIMSDSNSPGSENSSNCGFINKNQDVSIF